MCAYFGEHCYLAQHGHYSLQFRANLATTRDPHKPGPLTFPSERKRKMKFRSQFMGFMKVL